MLPDVLVCDPDTKFLDQAVKDLLGTVNLTVASDVMVAKRISSDTKKRFSALCVNASLEDPFALPLVRHFKAYRPATPIFMMVEKGKTFLSQEEQKRLHIEDAIEKPISPRDLIKKIIPVTFFEAEKLAQINAENSLDSGAEIDANMKAMHPISAESFLCGRTSFFDIYIKLGESRFLLLLKAGEAFDFSRIENYLKRGVKHFYIKREAQIFYLQYCDKLTENLLNNPNVPFSLKRDQVANLGAEAMMFLKGCGISESSLHGAERFVSFTHELIQKSEISKNPHVSDLLNNVAAMEHGGGVVFILSLLLEAEGFSDRKVIKSIAMGAMLHDIGLYQLPTALQDEDTPPSSEQDRLLFESHPKLGHDLLVGVRNISPITLQVVRQHHERRNRKGFPDKLGPGAIAPAAEMVGIADQFHRLMARKCKDPSLDVMSEIASQHYDEFSYPIMESFRKAFLAKR